MKILKLLKFLSELKLIQLCIDSLMTDVYQEHKDEDGFLYISYSDENLSGSQQDPL